MATCVSRDKWIQLTGSKGTLVVCDTSSCFHFGGRARKGERLVLEFHYTTSAPFYYNKDTRLPRKRLEAADGACELTLAGAMSVLHILAAPLSAAPAPMFKSPPPTIRLTDSRIGIWGSIIGEECWRLAQAELDRRL